MNVTSLIEKVVGELGDKQRWRAYKARVKQLPADYADTVRALERYLLHFGNVVDGDVVMSMCEDLVELFEQAAADGTPIRAVVGDDPVAFAEDFLQNYTQGQWINKERARLCEAVDRAAR